MAKDPRISGDFISAAVEAGLASGVDVYDAGTLPTPAAAYLVADLDADFGVIFRLPQSGPGQRHPFPGPRRAEARRLLEDAIVAQMGFEPPRPVGAEVGRVRRFADAEDRYIVHLLLTLPNRLDGLKVVLDCAHGAASGCSRRSSPTPARRSW